MKTRQSVIVTIEGEGLPDLENFVAKILHLARVGNPQAEAWRVTVDPVQDSYDPLSDIDAESDRIFDARIEAYRDLE